MINLILLLSIMVSVCSVAEPQQTAQIEPQSLVLTHATMLDMTDNSAKADMTVVVVGGRITAVGKTDDVLLPKNAQVVDATSKYLIPGLWDMHVHIFNNSSKPGTNN